MPVEDVLGVLRELLYEWSRSKPRRYELAAAYKDFLDIKQAQPHNPMALRLAGSMVADPLLTFCSELERFLT